MMDPMEESLESGRPGRRQIRNQVRMGTRNRAIKRQGKKKRDNEI